MQSICLTHCVMIIPPHTLKLKSNVREIIMCAFSLLQVPEVLR